MEHYDAGPYASREVEETEYAQCPKCHKWHRVNSRGTIAEHADPFRNAKNRSTRGWGKRPKLRCTGSGLKARTDTGVTLPSDMPVPCIYLWRCDVTEDYKDGAPELVEQGGKIYEVLFFDGNRHVHAAELTPSFEMHYLYETSDKAPEDDDEREEFLDALEEASRGTEWIQYVHCHEVPLKDAADIGKLRKGSYDVLRYTIDPGEWSQYLYDAGGDRDEAHGKLMEDMREHFQGNHYF